VEGFIELSSSDFMKIVFLFAEKKQYVPALSVIHGTYPGRVYVNHVHAPSVAVVWAIGRWMYAEGSLSNETEKEHFNQFIHDVVIPDCWDRDVDWFEIYTADAACWDDLFLSGFDNTMKVEKHYESIYTLNVEKFRDMNTSRLSSSEDITVDFTEFEILPKHYHDLPYVDSSFKEITSPGVALRIDNQILSICRNNGFVYGNEYCVDVDTFDAGLRKQGYATLAASQLIEYMLSDNMFPLWETTYQNIPSHKLALKLGFEAQESYPVYAFHLR